MSRYCGEKDPGLILDAAAHWRDVALLGDGSVFTTKRVWTNEAIAVLDRYFVKNFDEGEGVFLEKLKQQLAPASATAKQLAAEMMWVMYLCPSSVTSRHKRETVETVWSWSAEPFPQTPMMSDSVLAGVGSAGPGFNQYQWRELAFFINFMLAFRKLDKTQRDRLIADGWAFTEWLKVVPEWEARQFRHMLLFLLFPDEFERIFGQRDRKAVVQAFLGVDGRNVNAMDAVQLDRSLRDIRRKLETEYETVELDFYLPPLRARWGQIDFATVAAAVTADHVRLALAEIDRDGAPPSAQSTGYDLIEAGRRYPPKLVFSLAAKHATGQELDRSFFSGGAQSQCNKALQKLGFEIASKDLIAPLVSKFLEQAKAANDLTVRGYLDEYRGLDVRVSFGQGNIARIPWIAFLGKGQAVPNGIYPVLLYFRDRQVLLLCYGISETREPGRTWRGTQGTAKTVADWFRERFGVAPERYGQSYVRAAYEVDGSFASEELKRELDIMIDQYEEVLEPGESGPPEPTLPIRLDLGEVARSFSSSLKRAFVDFGSFHEGLVSSFIASIATKPFVILTGLSGSGKTQIAIKFGQWLGDGRLHVAAVRPDWTGAESLFGYEDGLKPAIEGRPAWLVPAPLEFMLQACHDLQHPYLLLLDEMNLAHVERYFADVLSGMESGEPCLPNLVKGSDGLWRVIAGAPLKLAFPRNLWVIGTVNVDETTYMFSPKVLDRASTFEFRVSTSDLQSTGHKPVGCEPGEPALVRGLLSLAQDDEWHHVNAPSFHVVVDLKLKQLHEVLTRYGLEFGHRVYYESLRFSAFARKAGLEEVESVIDRIVLQKILPRLHGSRRRLELPILSLAHFCRDLPEAVETDEKLPALGVEGPLDHLARLPLSYDKLCRMLRNLRANQFTSFTE